MFIQFKKKFIYLKINISDSIGLHRVENPSTVNPAVSLHLYSPPFSSCSVFNKQTGQRSPCKVTFWSKYGEHRNRVRYFSFLIKFRCIDNDSLIDLCLFHKNRRFKIRGLPRTINCEIRNSVRFKLITFHFLIFLSEEKILIFPLLEYAASFYILPIESHIYRL